MKQLFNSEITTFFAKVLGIYICWYLIYELWLLPDGTLDEWLALNIVDVSVGLLNTFGYETYRAGRMLGIGEANGILLVDGCTGISAIGLFVGFVAAYPGRWIPRLAFIGFGIGVIYLVNIIRICFLAITQITHPKLFDITHDYSTTAIFYIVIFALWVIWANWGDSESKK
ncbi:MAG: archaeosortase/exosortase family protein [Balneolaceae bacterium]|nr:archaeosortase/exosortase family protein [Balneolaceae bacterium]